MSRKLVSLVLSICLLLGLLSGISLKASVAYTTKGELTYRIYSDHVEVSDCVQSATNIVIPDKIDGLPVTAIASRAFDSCSSLESITIPDSVTSIESYAFAYCESITNITIPDSVTSIGSYAFAHCESITNITIPDSVTSIGDSAFVYCSSLKSIIIPNSVTSIEARTFYRCSSLKSITIPDSVTSIGEVAFYGCESLEGINIPDGIEKIEPKVFYGCTNLKSITIPDSVTSIGELAFYNCESLGGINIPDGIEKIEPKVFYGCTNLKSITIPDSVTSIGYYAFAYCESITNIAIPADVISIADTVFEGCSNKLVISCEPGSAAEKYAKEQGIQMDCKHKYTVTITPATTKKNGSIVTKCVYCGVSSASSPKTIYAASAVKLSRTKYTYNGKTHRPKVVVKDSKGNVIPASNYTVAYPKNSKNVNQYTVTVTFKGNYSGTKKLTYKIQPRKTSISKLTAKTNGFTIKLKKRTKQVTGYQIQYSTNKSFKGTKTVTIKKYKTTSKAISRLKAGKKYYVRVRTYKKVKINGKYKTVYSDWTKAKTVKTKK